MSIDNKAIVEVDVRTTRKQILKVEILDSNSTSCSVGAHEENASAQMYTVRVAQEALLALDNTLGGFAESEPDQGHKTKAMSCLPSNGARQF
jgi:hypothetical protein